MFPSHCQPLIYIAFNCFCQLFFFYKLCLCHLWFFTKKCLNNTYLYFGIQSKTYDVLVVDCYFWNPKIFTKTTYNRYLARKSSLPAPFCWFWSGWVVARRMPKQPRPHRVFLLGALGVWGLGLRGVGPWPRGPKRCWLGHLLTTGITQLIYPIGSMTLRLLEMWLCIFWCESWHLWPEALWKGFHIGRVRILKGTFTIKKHQPFLWQNIPVPWIPCVYTSQLLRFSKRKFQASTWRLKNLCNATAGAMLKILRCHGVFIIRECELGVTWRIIPLSKWLGTIVIVSPLSRVGPLPNGLTSWLINWH